METSFRKNKINVIPKKDQQMNQEKKPQDISIDKIIEDAKETQSKLAELNLKHPRAKLETLLKQIQEQDDSRDILEKIRDRQEDCDDEDYVSEEEFNEVTDMLYNSHCLYQEILEKINEEQDINSVRTIILQYLDVICAEMPDITAQRIRYRL